MSPSRLDLYIQCDKTAFALCLDFMYSGGVILSQTSVLPVLSLARMLAIDSLFIECEDYLLQKINIQNFVDRYFLSAKYNLRNLQNTVVSFVEDNITTVIESPAILTLDPRDFKDFVTQGDLKQLKQEVKFSLIISWVGVDLLDRRKFLLHLFNHVSWNNSFGELLTQISQTQNIFTADEFCLFQFLHSFGSFKGHHLGPFHSTFPDLLRKFSHTLVELENPKEFFFPSKMGHKFPDFPVSVTCEKSVKKFHDVSVNTPSEFMRNKDSFKDTESHKQDAAVNTDENFMFESEIALVQKTEHVTVNPDISPTTMTTGIEHITKETSKDEEEAVCNQGHRRKGLPRKLSVDTVKLAEKSKPQSRKRAKRLTSKSRKAKSSSEYDDEFLCDSDTDETGFDLDMDWPFDEKITPSGNERGVNNGCAVVAEVETPAERKIEDPITVDDTEVPEVKLEKTVPVKKKRGRPVGSRKKMMFKKPTIIAVKQEKEKRIRISPELESVSIKKEIDVKPRLRGSRKKPIRLKKKLCCTYENCRFRANIPEVLEQHVVRVHMTGVELHCQKCEFSTSDMKALCVHVRSHYSKSPPYR